ncbi:hypothetical protein IV203_019891 [Nitzschia inconspicua]|uniref:Uncharacterized protein n=1 Tax=Nitzschia inconspicua TaxID=303405 RepID=A0A9K3Q5D5_9STRA|nr:hypothetical protein IV203_019891 [Nitzschia inconspicua]
MANTNHLLDEIDVAVAALKVQKWTATLPFSGFLCKPTDDVLMASFQDRHDLFSFTQTIYKGFIIHRQNTATKAAVGELRQSTLVCDRKNSRGPKGQSLPKRTSTSKATNSKETCKVKLNASGGFCIPATVICLSSVYEVHGYSVGSNSEDKFMSMTGEDLFLYFQALMKNKLSILNYNIEHVEKAVAVMEKHQGNAVGMTQEMHNCSADFSFVGPGDETSDVADPVGSHEVLNPLYKELTQLCDITGKDKTAKTA